VGAHDLAVGAADFAGGGAVLVAVNDVPRHARHVARLGARSGEDGDDVVERLAGLGGEVVALELAARVPANLAGHEHQATLGGHAIGVAARLRPAFRLHDVHAKLRVYAASSVAAAL
jgi:hypothetical protein